MRYTLKDAKDAILSARNTSNQLENLVVMLRSENLTSEAFAIDETRFTLNNIANVLDEYIRVHEALIVADGKSRMISEVFNGKTPR